MQSVRVWFVLLVAIGGLCELKAQTEYMTVGTPTGLEEEIRWRVNRGRFDTTSENLLRGTAYTNVPASSGPLAPNQDITLAARHQSEDMAKANLFQHTTVPGSLYYNPTTQPNPWDRMLAEGYVWNNAGENIAAGYIGSDAVYVAWWNSTGHRANMYNSALREIGNGYYSWSTSTYRTYYTMDLGSSANNCFFTDTLFQDANGDGIYQQTEAVSGVAIRLLVGNNVAAYYDISSPVGSFAVPIQSIAGGVSVQVVLLNATSSSVSLNLPRDYQNYSALTLAPGESRAYGTFTQPSTTRNIGLRDLTPLSIPVVTSPPVAIIRTSPGIVLQWPSVLGLQYQPQWTADFVAWNTLTNVFMPGTGSNMTYLDLQIPGFSTKFYRLLVRAP